MGGWIVLTDIEMPKLDGIDLASRLKEISPNLPIIALTGATEIRLDELRIFNKITTKPEGFINLKNIIEDLVG